MRIHHGLLIALFAVAGCSDDTFLVATITRGNVPAETPIRGLQATIDLDGRHDMTPTVAPGAGGALTLPTTLSLEIGSGDGTAIIAANAYGDGSALLSAGSTELRFARGDTAELTIELGRHLRLGPDGGLDESDVKITPVTVEFGTRTLGTTREETFTAGNNGSGDSLPLTLMQAGASEFTIVHDYCSGHVLAPSDTCQFGVSFTPGAVNNFAANILAEPYESAAFAGVSGAGALFSLTPPSLGYGAIAVASSAAQTITVTNESTTAATQAISWTVEGADAGQFTIDAASTCTAGQILNPNQSCTLVVRFTPASAGDKTASLNVLDRVTMSLALTGTGT